MRATTRQGITRLLCLTMLVISAQIGARDSSMDDAVTPLTAVSLLLFEEEEPGTGGYPVRYLINDKFLRIDDGHDASDYILLDRVSDTIFSISHEQGNILVIHRQPQPAVPASLRLSHDRVPASGAPAISGRSPEHYRYRANDELCYEAMVVPGLMQAALDGIVEYEGLLAGQQAGKLENTPVEFRTPCFLSRYIYAPRRHLTQGLPLRVWDTAGNRRELVNFSADKTVPQALFRVPAEYHQLTIGGASDSLD